MDDNMKRFLLTVAAAVIFSLLASVVMAMLGMATVKGIIAYFLGVLMVLFILEVGRWLERNGH